MAYVEACTLGEEPLPPADSPEYQFVFHFGCHKCAVKAKAEAVLRGDEYSAATANLLTLTVDMDIYQGLTAPGRGGEHR